MDFTSKGYIKLHREIMNDPLYFLEPFTKAQAWIDLLLLANYGTTKKTVRGIALNVYRGEVALSKIELAKRWKWSRGKVIRFLQILEEENRIVQQTVQQTIQQTVQQNEVSTVQQNREMSENKKLRLLSKIIIKNYDKYSLNFKEAVQQNDIGTVQQTVQQTERKRYNKPDHINKNINKKNIYIHAHAHTHEENQVQSALERINKKTFEKIRPEAKELFSWIWENWAVKRRGSRDEAEKAFMQNVNTENYKTCEELKTAVINYSNSEDVQNDVIFKISNFFGVWENYTELEKMDKKMRIRKDTGDVFEDKTPPRKYANPSGCAKCNYTCEREYKQIDNLGQPVLSWGLCDCQEVSHAKN